MVTAEVIEGKRKEEKQKYPCLKISSEDGQIVFFTAPKKGITVAQGNSDHRIGRESETWAEYLFVPFTGSVTLRDV